MSRRNYAGCTGLLDTLLPADCQERDELLGLVRIGVAFKTQHHGRRPGFLHQYISSIVERMEAPVTFEKMLEELELEAARRNLHGEEGKPVEIVNRVWALVVYHHPTKGRQQVTFKTLKNILTFCKKA